VFFSLLLSKHGFVVSQEDSESKEKDGAESEKGGFRNNLMSGLVVSGIVVAVLGALVAVARNMKMRT